jgi:hypothetical protein
MGTEESGGKLDLYSVTATIIGCWEIMILMEFL